MPKILIVEDNEGTRELLIKSVGSCAGYEILAAPDGQTAWNILLNSRQDLVVLDIMLPEINGFTLCRRIKSHDTLKRIKVIILTAKTFSADFQLAEELGADSFFSKPVNLEKLIAKIKSLLNA